MSPLAFFLSFLFLGGVISLIGHSIKVDDIGQVWRPAAISFLKLTAGSAVGVLMVEALYDLTWLTYPVLVVLFAWLFFLDRVWQRWWSRRQRAKASSPARGS